MVFHGSEGINATFRVEEENEENDPMLGVCPKTLQKAPEPRINLPLSPGISSDEEYSLDNSKPATPASKRKPKKQQRSKPTTPASQRKSKPDKPLSPCNDNCHRKCKTSFTEEDRIGLFKSFHAMSKAQQDQFYARYIQKPLALDQTTKKGRRVKGRKTKTERRRLKYVLPKDSGNETPVVCAKYFYATLGYPSNCGNTGRRAAKSVKLGVVKERKSGKYNRDTSKHDSIVKDIKGYQPQKSHYKRKSCPNKYYIPGLTILSTLFCLHKSITPYQGQHCFFGFVKYPSTYVQAR